MSLKRVEPREIVSDRHFPWLLFFSNRVRVSKAPIEVPVVGMPKRIGALSIAPNYSMRTVWQIVRLSAYLSRCPQINFVKDILDISLCYY